MEKTIVKFCSPTLAGLKTGSLFCGNFRDFSEMRESLRRWNKIFLKKGVRVVPFENKRGCALIYVYRISRLKNDLKNTEARQILTRLGYSPGRPEKCIARLSRRIRSTPEFPHEIGLFLGYPPEDVRGFIEKRPCKFAGLWKIYGDVDSAKTRFQNLRKCTEIYCKLHSDGRSLERLTVSG